MSDPTVGDLTVDQLKALIREVVVETLSQLLGDPDEGLVLNDEVRDQLQQSLAEVAAGGKTIPARDVAARLGLTW